MTEPTLEDIAGAVVAMWTGGLNDDQVEVLSQWDIDGLQGLVLRALMGDRSFMPLGLESAVEHVIGDTAEALALSEAPNDDGDGDDDGDDFYDPLTE